MSSNTLREQLRVANIGHSGSDSLLAALKVAHRQIEAAFSGLQTEGAEHVSDVSQFSAKRMRVGQALLAKRQIVGKVASHLIPLVSAEEATAIRELRSRAHRYSQLASEIIRSWTPDEIQQDWSGYSAAASEMKTTILGLVAAEKELLYPLLSRQPAAQSGGGPAA